uniref:Lipid transport open beta-sheet domain-containing protein n=1 Tax=Monopterus albus TaxID=43700 RepID=A0A3Q3QR30_MONAL
MYLHILYIKGTGEHSTEATASLKYNRNKNIFTTEVVIPDYDVEAGIKLAVRNAKGKKMHDVTIDVTNKNIPQLTLVGHTRLEVELKSDLDSDIQRFRDSHRQLQQLIDAVLDQKVANTDMKLRHIVTKGTEVGGLFVCLLFGMKKKLTFRNNFQTYNLQPQLLTFIRHMHLIAFFYIYSALRKYSAPLNFDKMAISLPLALGGKKSEEVNIPTILSIPLLDIPEIGLHIPANNYPLPSFTVPPCLDFFVPLLGLAQASTKINSNFYTWEGFISGGNNTVDVPEYVVQYKAMAQSPFNMLSYKLEGKYLKIPVNRRGDNNLKYILNSSFSHCLIDTSFSILETLRVTNKFNAKANYKIEVSSPMGLQASIYYSAQSTSTLESHEVSGDGNVEGLLKIGSFYTNTSYTNSYNLRPLDKQGRGQSTLQIDSPVMQVHNMIHGVYANSELNIVSKTSAQKGILKNVAELKYKDAQLTLKSNTVATAMGKLLTNKVELGVSSHMAILRIESQTDEDTNRVYSLITGSLDLNGLELHSEGSATFDTGRGLHKASVMVGRNGLTMSGTNSIQCSPVTVENIFNGAIDNDGASLSSTTKAMAEESKGELCIEGKITAEEASLYGVLKGHAYDATTRTIMNVVLNQRGLTFTSYTMGTVKQMKTENSHTLSITLWTLALLSKTSNFICEDIYYEQDTKVDMKPFLISSDITNDLRFYDISLNNEGHMKLEPIKMDLSGSMRGAYGEQHNIKHTYEFTYDNMAGTMKYNVSGAVMEAQLSHNCELEFAGLSSKLNCKAKINSEPLHLDGTIRTMALPFSLTLDAFVSSDGEMNLYGKHTGHLYSKFLVKAEPLALACSHDSQVSTTHMLPSGETSTNLDSKVDSILTPSDQSLTWKVKSKMNNHAYNHDINTYNNPLKIGFEFSGAMLTDLFSKLSKNKSSLPEVQEFSMAGFLKYDKNSNCHIIEIPFIKKFPPTFEKLKNTVMEALESLQQFIISLDINQLIANFRANLGSLPMHVSDFMREMDLENKVNQVKTKLDYLINEFSVTLDDLELVMSTLRKNLENIVIDVATKIRDLILRLEDYIKAGHLAEKITTVLSQIGNQLRAFDEKYKIKQSLVRALHATEDIFRQINLQKLTASSAAWLKDLDSKYRILEKIKDKLFEMKQTIENFDVNKFFQDIKDYLLSFDLAMYVEQLSYKIPSAEIANVIESMNDVIVNWIDEYEIPKKLNAVYFYIRDLLLKYSLDDKFKELMDQIVILIKGLKIEETVQSVVDALKAVNFEFVYNKIMQFLGSVTSQLRAIDFKKSFSYINESISSMLKSLKDFDYSVFVDETNKKIAELTDYINKQIEIYEIVQKIEALRAFFRELQSSIFTYLDELKNTKVADALKKLKDVIDTTFYNDIKIKVQDILEDTRQRILDMDIREEIHSYLRRASESYSNIVAYISAQFNQLIELISNVVKDNEIISKMKKALDVIMVALKRAEIEVASFTLPLTDLAIPAFKVNLNKLQEIGIPAQILVPEFTILNSYTIPAFTIDFEKIKAKIIAIIDDIRGFEIQMPDPEEIFGDLKVLYLSKLPDFTFPGITLSEIKISPIHIPKLNLKEFEITVLPIPEIKLPEVSSGICIPFFGKLNGEFRVNSPLYALLATGKIENSAATPKNPQFKATITSHAKSPIEHLEYTFEATALFETPRMKKLLFLETMKATYMAFSINHEGSLTLTGSSAEASAKTTTKATTQMYMADLVSNIALTLKNGISAVTDTSYSHNLEIPSIEISSKVSVKQNITAAVKAGRITITGETTGNGSWSVQDYSDEGTHKSNIEFSINFNTANLTLVGETDCKAVKLKKTLTAESLMLSHVTVQARCETETPSVKKSVIVVNGEAHSGDLKVVLTVFHDAEFIGSVIGSMSNSLEFMAHPFEIVLDTKSKVNTKIFLPLKLTGKVDLQHDYRVMLNSEKQRVCWFALARFNQYKYNHNFTAENNEIDIFFHSSAKGEANLDFLTVPLSVPETIVPYLKIKTPEVRDLSLWEHAGFKTLLTTPQQSFEMNLKLHYYKNPDTHSFELHLEPVYSAISDNANIIQAQFEQYRDKVVAFLKESYNQAKSQYIKHKIDTSGLPPRIFTVPGYKIPILNIGVSSFRAELPAFSYFIPKEVSTTSFKVPALGFSVPSYTLVIPSLTFPVIHIPETLSEIKLPTFTLPDIQNNIVIPAMGNVTFDFSFRSTVNILSANVGLYNSDIVAQFGASSASVFDILNGKTDGTTSLTRKRGIKFSTTLSMEHINVEANHECAVSLTKRSMEASVMNTAKIILPFLNLELNQDLTGNIKSKPNIASKKKLKYMFNIPLIESVGKGNIDINWGKKHKRILNNNILQFDLNKDLALEVSLQRMFITVDYTSNNNVDVVSFNTNGRHIIKGELDFVPLTTVKITLNISASQPSSFGHARLTESINLTISSEKQSFTWSGKEQLASVIHACDVLVSSDESEVRMDLIRSVEGHLAFLKSVKLSVYQKTLWDVFKFDQVTNMENLQFLNISSSILYTKSVDEIPHSIRTVDIENPNVSNHLTLPPVISLPAFDVPFTNLHVEPLTIDPKNFNIPKVITTTAFEIMLPGLPIISVPSYRIYVQYLQGKMSFVSMKVPLNEIKVSSFTLPKSFNIGEHTFELNEITSHISSFELPIIGIPEQKIAIPEIALHLPLSVFIPAFGALSATLKVSSPIYNVSTTTSIEKKDSSLLSSLNSIRASTMAFLDYDFSGKIGIHSTLHYLIREFYVNWESRHTINVDITSQTFADASFRFASRKDGITAFVSSPSSGFLGLHLQGRSPSQLYGKLFSCYMKLILQTSWKWDFLHDVIEGTKDRIPAMANAVLKFINNYHTAHFGFDLNRGGMKLKNTVSSVTERAYREVYMSFNMLQSIIKYFEDQRKDMSRRASDSLMFMSVQDVIDSLAHENTKVFKHSKDKIYVLLDAVIQVLNDTKFTVPGSEERISSLELFQQV